MEKNTTKSKTVVVSEKAAGQVRGGLRVKTNLKIGAAKKGAKL